MVPKTLTSSPVVTRHAGNPILTKDDVPFESQLVFNAGVAKYQGRYVMLFRNDYGIDLKANQWGNCRIGFASSDDGRRWTVDPSLGWSLHDEEIRRIYDPRITVIDGLPHVCFAMDTAHGLRGGIAVTEDFKRFEIKSLSQPDNRNMVLFPQRLGGNYLRLDRPMPVYSRGCDRFDMWLSESPDLEFWGRSRLVLGVEDIPFADDKIGPGAPPVRTDRGWLCVFHAVDRDDEGRGKNGWEDRWTKRYTAGVALLDLEDPSKVVGMSKVPLLAPEAPYEVEGGYRNDVIFPGGLILEPDGEVKIYYGAADTVECLATANVEDLLALCLHPRK